MVSTPSATEIIPVLKNGFNEQAINQSKSGQELSIYS